MSLSDEDVERIQERINRIHAKLNIIRQTYAPPPDDEGSWLLNPGTAGDD